MPKYINPNLYESGPDPFDVPVKKKPVVTGAGVGTEKPTSPWEHFLLTLAMGPKPYAQHLLQTKLGTEALKRKYELYAKTRETPEQKQARAIETFKEKEEIRKGREKTSKQKFEKEYWALASKLDRTPEEQARFDDLDVIKRRTGGFQLLLPEDLNRLR